MVITFDSGPGTGCFLRVSLRQHFRFRKPEGDQACAWLASKAQARDVWATCHHACRISCRFSETLTLKFYFRTYNTIQKIKGYNICMITMIRIQLY